MNSQILTKEDLIDLTGYTLGKFQIQALEDMGFIRGEHFFVRPDGKPRMTWAALEPRIKSANAPKFEVLHESEKA
jgi:hypothetical protein